MSQSDFRFLTQSQVDQIHARALREAGGNGGTRDHSILEMLDRTMRSLSDVPGADAFGVAAGYAHYIARYRPYEGSNAATGLLSALVFLGLNEQGEHRFAAAGLEQAVRYLADRKLTREDFAQFLRDAYAGAIGTWADVEGAED